MTSPVRIDLPWPSRTLHPNARPHRMAKARATKAAREAARWASKRVRIAADAIFVTAVFTPPTYHARDLDGMQASIKAYCDGIADEIGIDDKFWTWRAPRVEPFKAPGSVTIEIEVAG